MGRRIKNENETGFYLVFIRFYLVLLGFTELT